jgi:hypothetical protein
MFQVFHIDVAYVAMTIIMYVSSVYFKCFSCFRLMLQVFYLNITKIDLDIIYVAMTLYACFKRMFKVFYLF